MAGSAPTPAEMLGQLEQARKLALADHNVYSQVVPGIVPFFGPTSALEIQRWGVANDAVPWAFYNLANVYRQLAPELCSAAENYAEVSYAMVVGDKETWPEVFSSSS